MRSAGEYLNKVVMYQVDGVRQNAIKRKALYYSRNWAVFDSTRGQISRLFVQLSNINVNI